MIRLLIALMAGIALPAASQARQSARSIYPILDDSVTIELPSESILEDPDGSTVRWSGRANNHRFVVEYHQTDPNIDPLTLLRRSAQDQVDAVPENATANYDIVQGPCYTGAQLSFEMWTPLTKPLGLLYSQVRLYVIHDYFLSLSIQGLGRDVDEDEASRFFNSLTIEGSSETACTELN